MREKEAMAGKPMEQYLPELLNLTLGSQELAAALIRVPKSTLNRWMLVLGIRIETVALLPGEEIEIRRAE